MAMAIPYICKYDDNGKNRKEDTDWKHRQGEWLVEVLSPTEAGLRIGRQHQAGVSAVVLVVLVVGPNMHVLLTITITITMRLYLHEAGIHVCFLRSQKSLNSTQLPKITKLGADRSYWTPILPKTETQQVGVRKVFGWASESLFASLSLSRPKVNECKCKCKGKRWWIFIN